LEQELTIAIIQYNVAWHNVEENLSMLNRYVQQITHPVDLVLLPEMFATGFTIEPAAISEDEHETVLHWMKDVSAKYKITIAGSHPFHERNHFFNRFFFVSSDGRTEHYDKRHPFTYSGEDKIYSRGKERKVIDIGGWKVFPLVCYDLRFPVWSRNTDNYELLVCPSNWPAVRNHAWETLLKARAIENQCYVAGVNRIGTDGKGIEYIGNSQIISPTGEILGKLQNNDGVLQISLYKNYLNKQRNQFPVLNDRDDFTIHT
jgi:omega-amidase